ncbi:hypothetical protein [Sphingomonas sp. ID0503]|uniref:hypothetical protein n=1 Tax=Sphingomonas sp. ID0503 TaxID=3399691 RepID=UPI003AFA5917
MRYRLFMPVRHAPTPFAQSLSKGLCRPYHWRFDWLSANGRVGYEARCDPQLSQLNATSATPNEAIPGVT